MPEAVAAPKSKYWNEEKKKFVIQTQLTDNNGLPVGPLQYFEADTLEDLLEKKDAAHRNAAVKLYETRRAAKLGEMLEPEPEEEPLYSYEERPLTADERVKIEKLLRDPATAAEGHKLLLEAQFGAPLDVVRGKLRDIDIDKRVEKIQRAVREFVATTPQYVECESNRENIQKWMEKNNRRWTAQNLKLAFEDLATDNMLVLQAPKVEVPVSPAASAAAAPATSQEIPDPSKTPAPAIPSEPTEVRPQQSSSGLGRGNSSAVPGATAPKTVGITHRDINRMSAAEYEAKLKDPEFRKAVEELYAKKK